MTTLTTHDHRALKPEIERTDMSDERERPMSLTTIECSKPGTAYTLFESGPGLSVHLAGPGVTGGTGPCLCGYDRHKHGGFSVGGGLSGPGVIHEVCADCLNLADDRNISGTHAILFDRGEWRDKQGDVWSLGNDGLMHTPETRPFPRGYVEKKWGPLTLVRPAPTPKPTDSETESETTNAE